MKDTETTDTSSSAESEPYRADDYGDKEPRPTSLLILTIVVGIFDTITDWIAWTSLRYSLLKVPDALQYVWLGSTIAGTVLLVIVSTKDVIYYLNRYSVSSWVQNHGWIQNCGWILSEFLLFLNLILEDLPILVMTYIYVIIQTICQQFDQTLDADNFYKGYLGLFSSALLTCLAIASRTFTCFRMCFTRGCCQCCCPHLSKKVKLCLQKTCLKCYLTVFFCLYLLFFGIFLAAPFFAFFIQLGILGNNTVDWNIAHSDLVASGNNRGMMLSDTETLVKNGSLFVTEAFHRNSTMTTYCLAYFELQPLRIAFNVAHINPYNSTSCVCNADSTPCDHYYEGLVITGLYPVSANRSEYLSIEDAINKTSCPLPAKLLQRDRKLHVNCNTHCDFSHTIHHLVTW